MDPNLSWLGIARQRFFHLGPRLELFNADVETFRAAPGGFDLVHAALVLPLGGTQVGVLSAAGDVVEARDLTSVGATVTLGPVYRF